MVKGYKGLLNLFFCQRFICGNGMVEMLSRLVFINAKMPFGRELQAVSHASPKVYIKVYQLTVQLMVDNVGLYLLIDAVVFSSFDSELCYRSLVKRQFLDTY